MSQERRFRGGLDGQERPFDWRALARRHGIPERDARELYEEAVRRASAYREPRRHQGSIYLELLEEARQKARRPSPGKVTRTMRVQARRAGQQRRSNISLLTGHPIAPCKTPLTSYIEPVRAPAPGRHQGTQVGEELTAWLMETASRALLQDVAPEPEESRTDAATRLYETSLAVALGNLDAVDAHDRELLADEYGIDVDAPRPDATDAADEDTTAQPLRDVMPPSMGEMRAFTPGREIHVRAGAFAPGTRRDDGIVAGERARAHVVQPPNPEQSLAQAGRHRHTTITSTAAHARSLTGAVEDNAPATSSHSEKGIALSDAQAWAAHERHLDELRRLLGLTNEALNVRIDEESRQRNEAQQSSGLVSGGVAYLHPERYEPRDQRGKYLLAHELVHVGQRRLGQTHGARAHLSVAEQEAHELASAFVRGQQLHAPAVALGTHAVAADTGSQSGDEAGTVVGSYARVVDVSPYLVLRRERDPRALPHDAETARRDPLVVDLLKFNERVMVLAAFSGNWVEVVTDTNKRGYIDRNYIIANPPEPKAKLYRTKSGDTALGIAMQHYNGVEWGKDSRFYVNVLVHTNRGRGSGGEVGLYTRDGSSNWQDAEVKHDYWIWIPDQGFAETLHGVVSSGSITYEAAETGKSLLAFTLGYHKGLFDGIKDALMDVVDLIGMVWKALESLLGGSLLEDLGELWDAITRLDAGALLAAFLTRWNHPDPWEKWEFRGWIIGFAIMMIAIEVLLALATGGTGNAVRWTAKAAKLGKLMDFLKGLGVIRKVQATVQAVGKKIPDLKKLARIGDKGTDVAEEGTDVAKAARLTVDLSEAPDTANDLIKRHWKQWSEKARRQYMEALEALEKGKALVRKMSDAELEAYQKLKRGEGTIDDVFPAGREGNKAFRIDEKYSFQKSARDAAPGYEAEIEVPLEGGLRKYLVEHMVPDRAGGKMPQELKALPRFKLESDGYTILIPKASWEAFTQFIP